MAEGKWAKGGRREGREQARDSIADTVTASYLLKLPGRNKKANTQHTKLHRPFSSFFIHQSVCVFVEHKLTAPSQNE